MKLKLIITLFLASLFVACASNEENDKLLASKSKDTSKKTSPINCYRYSSKSDTILLKAIHIGEAITGILVYNFEGKDKNKGTIQGSMHGDILVANYTFASEGIQSVRQVAFKLKDNSFIEGYGETETQNDKVHFKDLGSLKFNDAMKLVEIGCQ